MNLSKVSTAMLALELSLRTDGRSVIASLIARQPRPKAKKLSQCQYCEEYFGVAEMRKHQPKCRIDHFKWYGE